MEVGETGSAQMYELRMRRWCTKKLEIWKGRHGMARNVYII